jgi:DNA-binding MarR family transcriptional regulator
MDTSSAPKGQVTDGTDEPDVEAPWLTAEEQQLWRAHLEVGRLLAYAMERGLQPFGLAINDYTILVELSEAPERRMRMTDLATATLQSKSRLSHQITRMEAAGLVVREGCPGDRRGLYAVLTESGWETMRRVAPHHVRNVREHFIDRLDPEQIASMHAALAPIAEHLRTVRGRG